MQLAPLFAYLTDLAAHNEREWFLAHKTAYDQLRAQFETDVAWLAAELTALDPALGLLEPRKCMFRVNRDVRFSRNKDPYKVNFSAYFTTNSDKKGNAPGYYLQVGPHGQTLLAGGLYVPEKEQIAAIRQEIDYNAEALHQVLWHPAFQRYFAGLNGEQLKKAPAGYPADHPEVNLLRYKSFVATHHLPDAQAQHLPDLRTYVLEGFRGLLPLCQFLRTAIGQ